MLRKGWLAAAALLLLPALVGAYTIVLKDGRRLQAKARYTVESGVAKFIDTSGQTHTLPLAQIDLAATRRANRPRVWTNDDLEQLRERSPINVLGRAPTAGPTGEAAPGEEEAAPEDTAEEEKAPPKEETREYWQERIKPLHDELEKIDEQLRKFRQGLGQTPSNALDVNSASPGVELEDTLRGLAQRRTQIQRQLDDIRAEARRKHVPPGWVR